MFDDFVKIWKPDFIYWETKTPVCSETLDLISTETVTEIFDESSPIPKVDCLPDRTLTHWMDYAYLNGNFKYKPGTYTMFAKDCWYGKCTFCSWQPMYPKCDTMTVDKALEDVASCVNLGAKEIFDDSGSFPKADWANHFCDGMIQQGYNYHVRMGCNVRAAPIGDYPFKLMRKAGFRLLLWGVESGNQETLDAIQKGTSLSLIRENLKLAHESGLENHVTFMTGFPWEDELSIQNTVKYIRSISSYIDSLQVSICIPYPNTPLFNEVEEQGLLLHKDFNRYDMSEPVMFTNYDVMKSRNRIYGAIRNPRFAWHRVSSLRSIGDVRDLLRSAAYYFGRGR